MATLHCDSNSGNRATFTPISSALGALSNGPGTIVVLVKLVTTDGQCDFAGLTNSALTTWHHSIAFSTGDNIVSDDDGVAWVKGITAQADTTHWHFFAVTWPGGASGQTERFHYRDQSAGAAWVHENGGTNGGNHAGPGTSGLMNCGDNADGDALTRDEALVAVWNIALVDGDFGAWTKTSDLWNHAKGHPIFITELTSTTPLDLAAGSTFSGASSSPANLAGVIVGADPDNWTFDQTGGAAPANFSPVAAVNTAASCTISVPAPIASTEIEYHLSGGAGNANRDLSLGGAIATAAISSGVNQNVWDNPTQAEANSGATYYSCIWIKNADTTRTLQSAVVWIDSLPPEGSAAIGLDATGVGSGASTTSSASTRYTAPSPAVTFSTIAIDKPSGLSIGDIPAGQAKAIWLRRVIPPGAVGGAEGISIRVEGDSIIL